jgi:purine-binding chemotaxis protein CheW
MNTDNTDKRICLNQNYSPWLFFLFYLSVSSVAETRSDDMNSLNDDNAAILRTRAHALAKTVADEAPTQSLIELLEFRLADEKYGIETTFVQEVCPFKDLTPLPCTPPFLLGIVNVRGRILPVLDLKRFFELPEPGISDLHRIILVRSDELEFGILADVILGVRAIELDSLQTSLPTLTGIRDDYLMGVSAERLIVLDMNRILRDPRIIVQEEVEL